MQIEKRSVADAGKPVELRQVAMTTRAKFHGYPTSVEKTFGASPTK